MSEWQPIETAPNDQPLIGAAITEQGVRWAQSLVKCSGVWRLWDSHFAMDETWVKQLTHWTHVPDPPAPDQEPTP